MSSYLSIFLFSNYRLFGLLYSLLLFGNRDETWLCCSRVLLMDGKLLWFCMVERFYNWWLNLVMNAFGHLLIWINSWRLSFFLFRQALCLPSNKRSSSYFFTSPLIELYLKLFFQIFLKALTTINHALLEEIHPLLFTAKYIIETRKHNLSEVDGFSRICNISERRLLWSHKCRTEAYGYIMRSHLSLSFNRNHIFLQEVNDKHKR